MTNTKRKRAALLATMLISLLTLMFYATSCQQIKDSFKTETKVIEQKESPIEARKVTMTSDGFSDDDDWGHRRSQMISETVYYFYAEDGTSAKVDRKVWHKLKVGDSYEGYWR